MIESDRLLLVYPPCCGGHTARDLLIGGGLAWPVGIRGGTEFSGIGQLTELVRGPGAGGDDLLAGRKVAMLVRHPEWWYVDWFLSHRQMGSGPITGDFRHLADRPTDPTLEGTLARCVAPGEHGVAKDTPVPMPGFQNATTDRGIEFMERLQVGLFSFLLALTGWRRAPKKLSNAEDALAKTDVDIFVDAASLADCLGDLLYHVGASVQDPARLEGALAVARATPMAPSGLAPRHESLARRMFERDQWLYELMGYEPSGPERATRPLAGALVEAR